MSWRCPACQTRIRHSETEAAPRPGVIYRCHICRLELVVDDQTQKLTVRPFPDAAGDKGVRRPRR
jgi:DNA-directed RNA polymerase subunit RPC12/RpoP